MAKFREFVPKTLLADTDWLVGYDENGKYIRVPKSALGIGTGASGSSGSATLAVQYSANGSSWHDSYISGDIYVRIKAGSGAWSGAIRISVSAYDIWRVRLQEIGGYAEFLQQVNLTVQNAKAAIAEEVAGAVTESVTEQFSERLETLATKELVEQMKAAAIEAADAAAQAVLDSKLDKDLSNIADSSTIADGSYIPVVTDGDVKKVKMETVSAYAELKSATGRQSSTGQGEYSQQPESGESAPQPSSGVFDVTVTPDLWEENNIWRYVAVVHDENAVGLRSAFASPASETLQEWSDCPISLVSIEDGVLVFASPKALPAESITMKVYYKR